MKVLHVTPSFYPAGRYGGPTYSGYGLCNSLVKLRDVELRVLTTDSDGPRRIKVQRLPVRFPEGYKVYYCRRWLGADIAPGMFWRLPGMIRWADVVHLTAVYSPPTIPTLLLCGLLGKRVVWSTRGALQRWEGTRRARLKYFWEKLCDVLCRMNSVLLHVTSEQEKIESLQKIKHADAVIIPNGVESPNMTGDRRSCDDGTFRLLYLGRLHPIKGIENLFQAVAKLQDGIALSVCGEGEAAYQDHLKLLAAELDITDRVKFHGHVDGLFKEQQFSDADLCVAPSFKENFCIVVAEALARGLPVIASRGTPWRRLSAIDCGLWVDNDPETLANAISRAREMPLREMGERGRQWMEREYSWSSIAEQMAACYGTLVQASTSARSISALLIDSFKRLGLVIASVLMALLIAEGALRILWPQPTGPILFDFHRQLGLIQVPYQSGRRTNPGVYSYTFSNNSLGLRGSKEYGAKTKPRILILGDSFTYGVGVSNDETFCSLLQAKLPEYEVINAGSGNKGTDYALKFYQVAGRNLKPDLVILCFFANDFADNQQELYYDQELKPKDLSVIRRPGISDWELYRWLIRWSHLANLVKRVAAAHIPGAPPGTQPIHDEPTRTYLSALSTEVQSDNAQLEVFFIPSDLSESEAENTFEKLCASLGRRAHSFRPYLRPSDYLADGHWSASGHQTGAEVIYQALLKK